MADFVQILHSYFFSKKHAEGDDSRGVLSFRGYSNGNNVDDNNNNNNNISSSSSGGNNNSNHHNNNHGGGNNINNIGNDAAAQRKKNFQEDKYQDSVFLAVLNCIVYNIIIGNQIIVRGNNIEFSNELLTLFMVSQGRKEGL